MALKQSALRHFGPFHANSSAFLKTASNTIDQPGNRWGGAGMIGACQSEI
jgi:hypothetical protein